MLFFYEKLEEFYKGFSFIFGLGNDEDDDKGEEQTEEEGVSRTDTSDTKPNKTYGIMCLIKDYSDFTNTKWSEVWDINIIELKKG